MVRTFTPQKLANVTSQGFGGFFQELSVKHLPAYHCFHWKLDQRIYLGLSSRIRKPTRHVEPQRQAAERSVAILGPEELRTGIGKGILLVQSPTGTSVCREQHGNRGWWSKPFLSPPPVWSQATGRTHQDPSQPGSLGPAVHRRLKLDTLQMEVHGRDFYYWVLLGWPIVEGRETQNWADRESWGTPPKTGFSSICGSSGVGTTLPTSLK